MDKIKKYFVTFEKNGGEYKGTLSIECKKLTRDLNDDRKIIADKVIIRIDESIVRIAEDLNGR